MLTYNPSKRSHILHHFVCQISFVIVDFMFRHLTKEHMAQKTNTVLWQSKCWLGK